MLGVHAVDWHRPLGRPRRTWLRTIELDLEQHNLGLNSAWKRAQDRSKWQKLVETAMSCQGWATRWWWCRVWARVLWTATKLKFCIIINHYYYYCRRRYCKLMWMLHVQLTADTEIQRRRRWRCWTTVQYRGSSVGCHRGWRTWTGKRTPTSMSHEHIRTVEQMSAPRSCANIGNTLLPLWHILG